MHVRQSPTWGGICRSVWGIEMGKQTGVPKRRDTCCSFLLLVRQVVLRQKVIIIQIPSLFNFGELHAHRFYVSSLGTGAFFSLLKISSQSVSAASNRSPPPSTSRCTHLTFHRIPPERKLSTKPAPNSLPRRIDPIRGKYSTGRTGKKSWRNAPSVCTPRSSTFRSGGIRRNTACGRPHHSIIGYILCTIFRRVCAHSVSILFRAVDRRRW